ncbi:uncharacterized protein LOC141915082 [Tubulanus polymorphus]|uniref:uncharacterized protein LOC141915082 n=1 Tax=Tubulanus polymorphus TaxID=672921 RepID=UPI003DA1E3DB
MPTECCVPLCGQLGGHAFPKDESRRRIWVNAVRRGEAHWKPSRHSVVCRNHFTTKDYVEITTSGTSPLQNRLKKDAVPSVFPWNSEISPAGLSRNDRYMKRKQLLSEQESAAKKQCEVALYQVAAHETVGENCQYLPVTVCEDLPDSAPPITSIGVQCEIVSVYSPLDHYRKNDDCFHYYTGLES